MESTAETNGPFIPRPNEHERLVAFLTDQRFFLPVAITTSLAAGRGFGKTTLARAICQDPRVRTAFADGIFWVTLGRDLSPLDMLSRMEGLIFDISGRHTAPDSFDEAKTQLHDLLHPLHTLLVIDEADNEDALTPFFQVGPGGACLLITHNDASLPISTRRVPVDIMMPEEASTLVVAGLVGGASQLAALPEQPTAAAHHTKAPAAPPDQEGPAAEDGDFEVQWVYRSESEEESAPTADETPVVEPEAPKLAPVQREPLVLSPEIEPGVEALTDRLNDWPLLLALVNGLLRGGAAIGSGAVTIPALKDRLNAAVTSFSQLGLLPGWRIDEPLARSRALSQVITACLEPLSPAERMRCLELSVFPPDENVALAAVETLWGISPAETRAVCQQFAQRALVTMGSGGQSIRLHNAVHACLRDLLLAGQLASLHNRLIDAYHARCPNGWASGPDDGYYFQHLAFHLDEAGRREELQNLLFDFEWVSRFLNCADCAGGRAGDLYALIADYERALSTGLDSQSAELRLVQEALRMSARVLVNDPAQLAAQLLGRLLPFQEPEIRRMVSKAQEWQGQPWLSPLAGCFTPPGNDEIRVLSGHEDWITGIALIPDGQRAVTGSLDGTLRLWDLANGQVLRTIPAHSSGVSAVKVSADGAQAISAGWDGAVRIWNLASGQEVRAFSAHLEPIGAMTLTPDGKQIITGADDRLIRVWDLDTGKMRLELIGHSDLVRALAVTPDGRTLVSGSWDNTLRLWDLENGTLLHILTGHEGWVRSLAISPDGYFAVSGAWDRTLRVWDLWTGETVRMASGFHAPIFSLLVTPDGRQLIAGGGDGSVTLWNFETLEQTRTLAGHAGGVNSLDITPSGRFLLSGSDDRTLRIWDLVAVRESVLQPGHAGPVFALSSLPDGRLAVSGSWDGTLKVWQPDEGKEVRILQGHKGGVIAMAVTGDGQRAVSGSRDCTVRVWNLAEGIEALALTGHQFPVTAVAVTPDGRVAASGDDAGVVRAWDLASGALLAEFRGEGAIWACAISPDGRTIAASEASGRMYFLAVKR